MTVSAAPPPSKFLGHHMIRIETRVTSVQVVQGFPAHLAIPNPPGWVSSPHSNPQGSPEARLEPYHQPAEDTEGNVHETPPPLTSAPTRFPSLPLQFARATEPEAAPTLTDELVDLPLNTPSDAPTYSEESVDSPSLHTSGHVRMTETPYRPGFRHLKVTYENVFVNYAISRGGWIEEPPTTLDFGSCKDGPIIYVNEVTEKKVTQLWKWDPTLVRWSSVREGDVFYTARERQLELDRNRVPRLRAVRRRKKPSTSKRVEGVIS